MLTEWVDERLAEHGLRRTAEIAVFRERYWATVATVPTTGGTVWLKTMPPAVTHEAGLYEVLQRRAPRSILPPLGVDVRRGRLLLPDAGPSLADRAALDELPMALHAYGTLQLALAPHVGELLAAGAADMRPERLPDRFDEALDAVVTYARHAGENVGDLLALRPRYRDWCDELVAGGRPASLDHNDLHPGNVIGSSTHPRFYDWGDAVVAHPFASLLFPLDVVPDQREQLRDAYLAAFGDPADLRAEADLAVRVAYVARALVWQRILGDRPERHEYAAQPLAHLRRLLD